MALADALPEAFLSPPASASEFRSDHLDEIHAFIARYDGNHRRTALDAGPLGYAAHTLRCGGVDVAWTSTAVRQRIEGVPREAILQLPLRRRNVYAVGQRTLEARPDTAVLLPPGRGYALFLEPDDCLVVLRFSGARLAAEVRRRDRSRARDPSRAQELPLPGPRLATLAFFHRSLVQAGSGRPGDDAPSPAHLEARLCSWIGDAMAGAPEAGRGGFVAVDRVRAVEAWIDAHASDPVTLGDLCDVAGVGERFLETAFRRHRGETPMQFLTGRRLAAVRRRLLEAPPGATVTRIAHDAGFIHLGRFAARYRRCYGEPPSRTLNRAQAGR